MEHLCRLCAREADSLENVFSFENGNVNGRLVSDLIMIVCPIRIEVNDNLPKNICDECKEIVVSASKLRETCVRSEIKFRNGTFIEIPEEQEEPMIRIKEESFKFEEVSIDSENFFTITDQIPSQVKNEADAKLRAQKRPRHSLNTDFRCIQCEISFHNIANYRRHYRKIHRFQHYQPFKCSICNEDKWTKQALEKHQEQKHPGYIVPLFRCDICSVEMNDKILIEDHLFKSHTRRKTEDIPVLKLSEQLTITCPVCFRNFTHVSNLSRHIKKIHKLKVKISQSKKKFQSYEEALKCDQCLANFKDKESLQKHLAWHMREKPKYRKLFCEKCDQEFISKAAFIKHCTDNHLEEREKGEPYRCDVCDVTYPTQWLFNEHIRADHKYFFYDCYHLPCRKRFASKLLFHKHLKTHKRIEADPVTGSFICKACLRSFGCASHLTRHILTNHFTSQEREERTRSNKEFLCFRCGKDFTTKRALEQHTTKNHDE